MVRYVRDGDGLWEIESETPFFLDEIAQTHLYPTPGTGMLMAMGAGTDIVNHQSHFHSDRLGTTDFMTDKVCG